MNEYYSLLVSIWIFSLNIKTEQKEDERRFHSSYNYLTFPALQPWRHSNGNNYISIFFDGDIYFSHYVEDLGLSGMPSMNNHQMKLNWKWNIEHRGEIKYFWIYICLPLIFKTHCDKKVKTKTLKTSKWNWKMPSRCSILSTGLNWYSGEPCLQF